MALIVGVGAVIVAGLSHRANARKSLEDDGKWKGRVDTLLEELRNSLSEVEKNLNKVGKELGGLRQIVFDRLGIPLFASTSPLQLTEFGKTVSEEVGSAKWVERVASTLGDQITGKDAYAIQDFCFKYVEDTDKYRDAERRAIRKTAFERGLKTADVRRVLAHRASASGRGPRICRRMATTGA